MAVFNDPAVNFNSSTTFNDNTVVLGSAVDGLYWFEYTSSGTITRYAIAVAGGKVYQMAGASLAGTWTDITGSLTITAGYHCDFETFMNKVWITNGKDKPFFWGGSGNATVVPAFTASSYTFQVSGITSSPAVGDTYTNNAITYTVVASDVSGSAPNIAGQIIATGSGAPSTSGTLTRATGSGDATITFASFGANTNITAAKYVKLYNNYLFWLNVTVGSTYYPTREYWTNIKDYNTILATSWIEVAINDGQEITGSRVLGDNLIIFKNRAIYAQSFTGDADFPFILPGGGKTNSSVGCIAPFSITESENGITFLSYDGIYLFDGGASYKLSDRITTTLFSYNTTRFNQCVSTVYRKKNLVFFAFPTSASTTNNVVIVWNYFLNSWSLYTGMNVSAIWTFYVNGLDERPYFGDYSGYVYRMDTGSDDYPLNVKTAINSYFYTNWKTCGDLVSQKYSPQVDLYYQLNSGTMTFSYSYDFETSDQYTNQFSMNTSTSVYGSALYGSSVYGGTGSTHLRRDITGRGRVIRFGFKNANLSEAMRIEGFGIMFMAETNV